MPTVKLLSKIHYDYQLKLVESQLKHTLKGLKVKIEKLEATTYGWIQVNFSGEDERAALKCLEEEIGICPLSIEVLKKFSTTKAYILSLGKDELRLDVGVILPESTKIIIPLKQLQVQLADGRKTILKELSELFGFCKNMPLTVKIKSISEKQIEASLAEKQLNIYKRWTNSMLDRLIVLGASHNETQNAIKISKCQNDVVSIESLGLFEDVVVCKLGTDAIGLIPKIGKKLRHATITVFSPKKVLEFLNCNTALLL